MTADKRSVSTDALETLGTKIDDTQRRDAIHLAVEPITAKVRLFPGQHVDATGNTTGKHVGIVDPFLTQAILPGERFWLVIYPRQIKSLRHVWTHPDFDDNPREENDIEFSTNWIKKYAESLGIGYLQLMNGAYDFLRTGDYLCIGGVLEGETTSKEFWDHYCIVNSIDPSTITKESFFTCSC